MTKITNLEAKLDAEHHVPVIAFELDGKASLEWLDEDGTLCAAHESNVHNTLDTETANVVREHLHNWLSSFATISVAVNGVGDFYVLEVPADADEADIAEAVEAENNSIGGSDSEPIFAAGNSVSVYRNGVEIDGLRQDQSPRAS